MKTEENASPIVSVITLAYRSVHLQHTVESVLGQSYHPIEYIISDDGTPGFDTEYWKEYIRKHPHSSVKRLQVIHHKKNQGTVKNLNCALEYAHGIYYIFLSGDDIFTDKNVVRDWVRYFQNTNVLFATSTLIAFDETLSYPLGKCPSQKQQRLILEKSPLDLFEYIAKGNFIIGCTTAYTAEFWKKYGKVPECYRLIEDHVILLRALRNGEKIGFFPRDTICYRGGGVSDVLNYDRVYCQENALIYKQEIAPYTNHPVKTWWNYQYWKIKRMNDKAFVQGHVYCRKHPYLWGLLALRHPVRAIRKFKRMLQGEQ